jgi:hypothetical protein
MEVRLRIRRALIVSVCAILGMQAAQASDQDHAGGQTPVQAQKEAEFFKSQEAIRQKAANDPSRAVEVPVELKREIEAVIGPVKVDGFPVSGRMLPHLISDDPCCDQINFLEFKNTKDELLYVSTKGLVDNYLTRNPGFAAKVRRRPQAEGLYFSAVVQEYELANFSDLPVHGVSGKYIVRAFLGRSTHEGLEAIPPYEIWVFLLAGDRIYFMKAPTVIEIPDIPDCQRRWYEFGERASVSLDAYHASNKKDEKLWLEFLRLEEQGFAAYTACYRDKSRNMPFFATLVNQAQFMVDRIQPD